LYAKLLKQRLKLMVMACLLPRDAPNEYHVNGETGELWFIPESPLTASSKLVVSVLDTVINVRASFHSFVDLALSDARQSPLVFEVRYACAMA
jgi:hypothetical protein